MSPTSATAASAGSVVDIFRFSRIRGTRNANSGGFCSMIFGPRRPNLQSGNPLVLFYYADLHLQRSVEKLQKRRRQQQRESQQRASNTQHLLLFRQALAHVHQAQKLLLETVQLLMHAMPPEIRSDRGYRAHLSNEDRRELDEGYSENILFAAQALTRGFRIRGIEPFTERLQQYARLLCAAVDALRFVVHQLISRRSLPGLSEYGFTVDGSGWIRQLVAVMTDFDHAWTQFEHAISYCYVTMQNANRQPVTGQTLAGPLRFPQESTTRTASQELMLVLFSETVLWAAGACQANNEKGLENSAALISMDDVQSFEPYLMFAIPRLALVNGLVLWPEYFPLDLKHSTTGSVDSSPIHHWFAADRLKLVEYARRLRALNPEELSLLRRQLVTSVRDDHSGEDACNEETDFRGRSSSSVGGSIFSLRQDICALVDSKHSGPYAKELNALLGRLFKLYAVEESTSTLSVRRNTLKPSDMLLLRQPLWRRVWNTNL